MVGVPLHLPMSSTVTTRVLRAHHCGSGGRHTALDPINSQVSNKPVSMKQALPPWQPVQGRKGGRLYSTHCVVMHSVLTVIGLTQSSMHMAHFRLSSNIGGGSAAASSASSSSAAAAENSQLRSMDRLLSWPAIPDLALEIAARHAQVPLGCKQNPPSCK